MKTKLVIIRILSLIFCLFCTTALFAQSGSVVTGIVVDENGETLPGASVVIMKGKDMVRGTSTGIEGEFKINVYLENGETELVVSYIGSKNKNIKLTSKNVNTALEIQLQPDEGMLEEVTIVEDGYARLPRKDMVGAFTTVKAEDIMMPAYQSVDQMLQGKIAGMTVVNSSARVGATPKITIRGTSTILGNSSPLWVVDGVIQEDALHIDMSSSITGDMKELIGNQISWLNPQDIDNITVLKDASATAVYGSKASNGVIVITTKKGTPGRVSVNYNTNVSVRERPSYAIYDLMNSQERIQFSKEAYEAGVRYQDTPLPQIYTYEGLMAMFNQRMITEEEFSKYLQRLETVNTDWFDLLTRNSVSQSHNLSISGGTDKYTYNASVGYQNNKGMEIGNDNNQLTTRLSINSNINDKLSVNVQLNGSVRNSYGYAGVNPYTYALNTNRALPAYEDEEGKIPTYYSSYYGYQYNTQLGGHNQYSYNVFNELENSYSTNVGSMFNASANVSYKILSWLTYQGTASFALSGNNSESYQGEKTSSVERLYRGYAYGSEDAGSEKFNAALMPYGGILKQANSESVSYSTSHRLQFSKEFNENHRLNTMLGMEIRSSRGESTSNTVWGYIPERGQKIIAPTLPENFKPIGQEIGIGLGALQALYDSGGWNKVSTVTNYLSFFGIVAYSFMNRYVINMNVRSDASNRFGQDVNKQFDPTWSFGASWKIAQEPFMMEYVPWIEQFNIRATYGIQGNVVNSISPDMIVSYQGMLPSYNEYYLTISSLPNRQLKWERTKTMNLGADISLFGITMNMEYYMRRSNAIIRQDIAQEYGMNSMPLNGGLITNEGFEFSANYTPIRGKDFAWTIGFNASKNWNRSENEDLTAKADELNHYDFLSGSSSRPLKKGKPLSAFWSYKFTGLDPNTGYPTFDQTTYDKNEVKGDGSTDPATFLVYSGQSEPDFTGGFNTRIRWKGFNLGLDFAAILGAKKRLPNPYSTFTNGQMPDIFSNLSTELNDRWKKPGDEKRTNIPALYTSIQDRYNLYLQNGLYDNIYSMWAQSDIRVASASFLRCTQMSLSYSFPRNWCQKIRMSHITLSANINNLFVIASKEWRGYDPELGYSIQPRMYSLGLSIGL